jgi:23S rRNA (guanosine2251-2'-O)-methyltransferase
MIEKNKIVYGFHSIKALLNKDPKVIQEILIDKHREDQRLHNLINLITNKNIRLRLVSREEIDALALTEKHQGVLAILKHTLSEKSSDLYAFLEELTVPPFLLILDGLQDPHNLGACLRTANAAGVHAVIAPKDKAVGITPVVTKVASGAVGITPFFQVTNLVRTLEELKKRGVWLFGTSDHALLPFYEANLLGPVAIIVGAEEKGLRHLTEQHCDFLINIPMLGEVSSLNVSVATGICLFEVIRQRKMQLK